MKNLINLILVLMLTFLVSCFGGIDGGSSNDTESDETAPIVDTEDEQEPPAEPPISEVLVVDTTTDTGPVVISIMSGETLYFYNGEFQQQSNVNPKECGYRCFTDGVAKVFYDEFGQIENTELLFMEPDFIVDDWIVENIEPAEALAMGALYKDYSRFYFRGVEFGNWFLNGYKVTDFVKTITGEIIAISGSTHYSVVSDLGAINHADKLIIHEFDGVNKTAAINDISVSWSRNYFNQAKQWQFLDGVWYSWNGYEFTDDLQEFANGLWNWNEGEKPIVVTSPTVISAGSDVNYLYWVECNTGWLISFNPEFDQINTVFQLYQGDGQRLSGIDKSLSLKPALVDGVLYFNDNGLRKIDIVTGISELVMGVGGGVLRW